MVSVIKWDAAPSATTLMSTELNALANDAFVADGADYDNSTNLDTNADFELFLDDFAAAPDDQGVFELHCFPKLDGSKYLDGSTGAGGASANPNSNTHVGDFRVDASDADQYIWLREVTIPPCAMRFAIYNKCGQALSAVDTHTLKIYAYNRENQ